MSESIYEEFGPTRQDRKRLMQRLCRQRFHERNPDYIKTYRDKWRSDNPDYTKQCYAKHRDVWIARSNQWQRDNPTKVAQRNRLRATSHRRSKPLWANQEAMDLIYTKRDELNALWGTKFQVDHIVPLQGDSVCGLHCEDNLQLLEKSLNCEKRHFHWPDMP